MLARAVLFAAVSAAVIYASVNGLRTADRISSTEADSRATAQLPEAPPPEPEPRQRDPGTDPAPDKAKPDRESESTPPRRKSQLGHSKPSKLSQQTKVVPASQGWSDEDVENAGHFVSAIQASDQAWSLCEATHQTLRPWLMGDREREEFARLINLAHREADLVHNDVLARVHPQLPVAFKDFVSGTFCIPANVLDRKPTRMTQDMWQRWFRWRQSYWSQIRLPPGVHL
jgi:hypothetical protein